MENQTKKEARAITKYVRISPRKARLVADLIRGQDVLNAMTQLDFTPKKAAHSMSKTLMSAVANLETSSSVQREQMIVKEVRVDEGPTLKRARPRNKGSRVAIMKRMSHLHVVVAEKQNELQEVKG